MRNVIWLLLLLIVACGQESAVVSLPRYTEMRNVADAPAPLRNAADAVVLLLLPSSGGTAFFVSPTGLLMTNNHVLGAAEETGHCARQGCYVRISKDFQIGKSPTEAVTVFAEPKKVSVALDVSLFQLWKEDRSERLQTPSFLTPQAVTAREVLGRRVYAIGHPLAGLKKWTAGYAFSRIGNWFQATNFGLPGNSGSPIVDDSGRLVGIVHRASRSSLETVQRNDVMSSITASSGAELVRFLDVAPADVTPFFDLEQIVSSSATLVAFNDAYLMARRTSYRSGAFGFAVSTPILDTLETQCQAGLRRAVTTPNQFSANARPCREALTRLNCIGAAATTVACPAAGARRDAWRALFARAAELSEELNQPDVLFWLTRAGLKLETTLADAKRVGREAIEAYVRRDAPPLDLLLAHYLLNFGAGATEEYRGRNLLSYFLAFRDVPRYEYAYNAIRGTLWNALDQRLITPRTATEMVDGIFEDPRLPFGDKLDLEADAYRRGYFSRQ